MRHPNVDDNNPNRRNQMTADSKTQPLHIQKPSWLKTNLPSGKVFFSVQQKLRDRSLVTVCEEAKCPNISECWNTNTATFMVLGDTCTRGCRFCHIKTGNPQGWLDLKEPVHIAKTCQDMGLAYVVITMVNRDDLEDGGAGHLADVLSKTREYNPQIRIEILAGDFQGSASAIDTILVQQPEVYAHNIETIQRLSPKVRDARASYLQSLKVLALVKERANYPVLTKSAIMLGLGEERSEVLKALDDLRASDVDFITIGQYMRPTKKHLSIKRWVPPEEFNEFGDYARSIGFKGVASAPLVRSSYRAREFYESAILAQQQQG